MSFARGRRTAGVALMAASLLGGILAAPSAIAAEAEVPEDAQEIEPTRQAFWNADQSKYANNSATSQFPPQAVCLVQPQACFFPEGEEDPSGELGLGGELNEGTQSISDQEQALLASIEQAEDGQDPADTVQEGDLPVSVAFGEENYRSAIEFELPPLPDGEQVASFTMVLAQGQPTYSNESPAFRQAVLAALTCASENEEPQGRCTREEFEKIPEAELTNDSPLQVQVCPIVGDWSEGRSQDEDTLPEVNCLYTTAGAKVEGEEVWVFDLAMIAQAWYDGDIEPKGLLLAPGSAENLAYGDSEQTYSKQVTFTSPVQIAMSTEPEPEPPPAPPAPPSSSGFTTGSSGSNDVFGTPPAQTSGGSGGFATPQSTPSQSMADEVPEVSAPAETAPPQAEEPATLAAGTPLGTPETPWWLWLLVPMFLAGAWLLSRSLEEQVVATSERSGAMSRLLERRAATTSDNLVTG